MRRLPPQTPTEGAKAPFPGFIDPALATSIEKVPSGARWIHEINLDGYRIQVHLRDAAAKVFTRRGNDWTKRFRKIADDACHVSAGSAIIDEEVVVPVEDGTTDFSVLLQKLPLIERKAQLKKIIADTDIHFSENFEVDGSVIYADACKVGLEGVVSKVRDSRYTSGRGNDWVKKSCAQRETLTIAGFALDGSKWDGIYLGRRKGNDLIYAGQVDHGFDKVSVAELRERLMPLIRKTQPYAKKIAHKAMGRTGVAGGDRIPGRVGGRQSAAPVLQGLTRGPVMVKDAFDRWWEWVEKPADTPLSIPSHFHEAIMRLAPEQRRDRATVNEAVRLADPDAHQ